MGAFKGWQSTRKNKLFAGFPALRSFVDREAFGFQGVYYDFDPRFNTFPGVNGVNLQSWWDTLSGIELKSGISGFAPTFINPTSIFNNLPSVNFPNINSRQLVFNSEVGIGFNYNSFTLLSVHQQQALSSSANVLINQNTDLGQKIVLAESDGSGFGFASILSGSPFRAAAYDLNPVAMALTSKSISKNGTTVASGDCTDSFSFKVLGSFGSTRRLSGSIARLIIFNHALSDSDLNRLTANAKTFYNLP